MVDLFNFNPADTKTNIKKNNVIDIYLANPTHENFNNVWTRYQPGLKKYAYNFLKDYDAALDAVIQTFANAWEKRDTFDKEKGAYSTWLYKICFNVCLGVLNKKKKDKIYDQDLSECYDSVFNSVEAQSMVMNPEENFIVTNANNVNMYSKEEILKKMYDVSVLEIENLPKKLRSIVYDKLVGDPEKMEGMKIKDIAEKYNMNPSNVKNRLYEGKRILSEAIKEKYGDLYNMYLDVMHEKSIHAAYTF